MSDGGPAPRSASRVYTKTTTALETKHPTDHHWWGRLELEPAGKTLVHVFVVGGSFGREPRRASLPLVELDELQELIDRARERCASMGFLG